MIEVEINNRKAYHDYFVLETIEAGIVLTGTEIKSIRENGANIKDSYAIIKNNEVFLLNMHITNKYAKCFLLYFFFTGASSTPCFT